MKAVKVLSISFVLLLLAVVGAATYLVAYLDDHRDLLAESVGNALGREVRIEEGVSLDWSMTPSIVLNGLWVGNPDWAKGGFLGRAERALVSVRLLGLLRRQLDLRMVTIQKADIALEETEDGKQNWVFGGGAEREIDVRLFALKIENSRVSYLPPGGEVRRTDIPEIILHGLGTRDLGFEARVTYNGIPVKASLTSRQQAVSKAGERPFEGKVEISQTTLKVRGELRGLFELTKLEAEVRSERLDIQQSAFNVRYPIPVQGVLQNLDGRFETDGDSIADLVGNLKGRLKIGSASLAVPVRDGGLTELSLKDLKMDVSPDQPVRLSSEVTYQKEPFQVELDGGLLGDLFSEKKSWTALKFRLTGKLEGNPLELTGSVGPLSAILSGRNLNVQQRAKHGEMVLGLDGRVANIGALQGSRLNLDISGPSMSLLTPWLGVDLPQSRPFRLRSQLSADKNNLQLRQLKLTVGEADIAGNLSLPLASGGRVEGTLHAQTLDLSPLLESVDKARREAPTQSHGLLENELPLDTLDDRDGSLRLKIERLHLRAIELEQLELDGRLDNGHLRLSVQAEGGRAKVEINLKPAGSDWRLALRYRSSIDLRDLIDRDRHADERSRSPVNIDADLEGTGRTLAAMLESTEGRFTMEMGEGRLSENISKHIPMGDVLYAILRVVDPLDERSEQARLECAVIHLRVAKGVATTPHGLAIRTEQMNVLGGGGLTARDGAIDLEFKTAQRKGLGLSVVGVADRFLRLTGTLWEPTVSVNPKSAVAYGTAAVATGGLSILLDSAFRRLTSFDNPCEMVQKALGQ